MEPRAASEPTARVSSLHIYPVKSCAGISVDAWPLDAFGLYGDRRYMIVRPDGMFVTQREHPRLSLVRTAFEPAGPAPQTLVLEREGAQPLRVPMNPARGEWMDVTVWRSRVRALRCGLVAERWLSEFLGEPVRLVFITERTVRECNPAYAPGARTGFADGYPLLLLGEASLAELNARLVVPVPMDRFRPNVVVHGVPAHAEDDWRELTVGGIAMRVVKPCARCSIVTVDQTTGESEKEPLRTLATYRRRGNDVFFGQNVIHLADGVLRVGAPVVVAMS